MSFSPVTSEALQQKLRQLLPSQRGFGTDISASDTIVPIIDLTEAAEGSQVPEYLQRAQAFGSQTAHLVANTTTTLVNTTGFYQITGVANIFEISTDQLVQFALNDGATDKIIYEYDTIAAGTSNFAMSNTIDFIVFLRAGDSLKATASLYANFTGSSRQVADINGTLTNPVGFTPQ